MICKNCQGQHNGSYASGTFCSMKCARGFSTKANREEISAKAKLTLKSKSKEIAKAVSLRMKGVPKSESHKESLRNAAMLYEMNKPKPTSLKEVSKRTSTKIIKRLNLGCSNCGWDKTLCDIHHIVPRSKGGSDDHENLTYLCPNCHRLAHEYKLEKFVSLKVHIGDRWIDYYYPEKAGLT